MEIKTELTIEEIVEQIGRITPVGETHIDNERFERQLELENLTDELFIKIKNVAEYKSHYAFSINRAGEEADKWLRNLRDELNADLGE